MEDGVHLLPKTRSMPKIRAHKLMPSIPCCTWWHACFYGSWVAGGRNIFLGKYNLLWFSAEIAQCQSNCFWQNYSIYPFPAQRKQQQKQHTVAVDFDRDATVLTSKRNQNGKEDADSSVLKWTAPKPYRTAGVPLHTDTDSVLVVCVCVGEKWGWGLH